MGDMFWKNLGRVTCYEFGDFVGVVEMSRKELG